MRIFLFIFLAVTIFIFSGCAKKEEPAKIQQPSASVSVKAKEEKPEKPFQAKGEEKILYSFENSLEGWEIPDWALEKEDHVAKSISLSKDFSKEGTSSLKVDTDFPGKLWTASVVEVMEYLDLGSYKEISCDIYIPKEAPEGLKAKIIVTVGDDWKFTEMSRSILLIPGEWTTVKANILSGSEDWKATVVDDYFRRDVRKIVVRIESNRSPVYVGSIYLDNIKVSN